MENLDWKLSLPQFINCLTPIYHPQERKSALEDEVFEDGAETHRECNMCVCACRSWVCTVLTCHRGHQVKEQDEGEEEMTEDEWRTVAELNALQVGKSDVMAGSVTSSSKERPASRTSFIPELQSMMFALGDTRRPLYETAALVEDIVHTQLITMLHQASEGAALRGSRVISAEDILFLMRRDKRKLARVLKYLQFRDYKSKLLKNLEEEDVQQEPGALAAGGNQRRQRLAQDFLGWMDQTGEFLSLAEKQEIDPVKQERMERLERHTRNMDPAQYAEFCESRQLSFAKKASKFRDWLDCSSLELKPNSIATEILSYLAYETVAQIVDLSLLVKQEMTVKTNPVSHVISASYIHYNTHTEVKKDPDSPEATPPSTPGSSHSSKPLLQGNGSMDSRARQRKRKKSSPATVEPPSGAIQPCHIREAIRRYNYRHTTAYRRSGMAFLTC